MYRPACQHSVSHIGPKFPTKHLQVALAGRCSERPSFPLLRSWRLCFNTPTAVKLVLQRCAEWFSPWLQEFLISVPVVNKFRNLECQFQHRGSHVESREFWEIVACNTWCKIMENNHNEKEKFLYETTTMKAVFMYYYCIFCYMYHHSKLWAINF